MIERRCNRVYEDKLNLFQRELDEIPKANKLEFAAILKRLSSLHRELRMSGYFVSKRPDILREWAQSQMNISSKSDSDKVDHVLSALRGVHGLNQRLHARANLERPTDDETVWKREQLALYSDLLVENSKRIAFELDVFAEHGGPQRIVAGFLHPYLWDIMVRVGRIQLPSLFSMFNSDGTFIDYRCGALLSLCIEDTFANVFVECLVHDLFDDDIQLYMMDSHVENQ